MEADSNLYGLLRHLGTIIGALLVRKGFIDSAEVELIAGLVIAAGSVLWSIYNKRQTSKTIDVALALPPGATREDLEVAVATDAPPPAATPEDTL